MGMQRLLALCHVKNELNKRRRRFWYYANPKPIWDREPWSDEPCYVKPKRKHISIKEAKIGYRKAQREMKQMTTEMRALREQCGAKFIWNDNGAIEAVRWSDRTVTYKHFKKYHEMEMFEVTMLSETE
jgi:hypothetical protein